MRLFVCLSVFPCLHSSISLFVILSIQLNAVYVFGIDIKSLQNRLLKVCYVPATSASLPRVSLFFSFLFLLLQPLIVLMKQTRWLKQSIFFICLWSMVTIIIYLLSSILHIYDPKTSKKERLINETYYLPCLSCWHWSGHRKNALGKVYFYHC